jgi:nucleotide sugar dehydrogenase
MKIGLIGAGRLGLCLALLMDKAGYSIIASDVREDYIDDLHQGKVTTTEPLVGQYLESARRIEFTTDNLRVIEESDIIFTLVLTPSLENGSYDVSNVDDVVSDILKYGWDKDLSNKSLVIGCTTNPGDCDFFQDRLKETGISVFYNPEFIAQGSIIKDLQNADMVLLGGDGKHKGNLVNIYKKIQYGYKEPSIHLMSTKAAEITKIAVNCFLTTKISYANMIGQVLAQSNLYDEIETVLSSIGSDSRIGHKYMNFGFGFGGPCFPRDNRAFASYAQKVGVEHNIGTTTDNFNKAHLLFLKDYFVDDNSDNLPFCFDYIAYKPGTDILTESQQYQLCLELLDLGYKVYVSDNLLKGKCDARILFEVPDEKVYRIDL